jgi:hypothetical protein
MEKKVNSRQHIGIISRGACAFVAIVTLIGFNTLTVGCGGNPKKTTPSPNSGTEIIPPGQTTFDLDNIPSAQDISRLNGTTPYFSQIVGPFVINGKNHYYQAVRYNVGKNRAVGSNADYTGARPNWVNANVLAGISKYTVNGVTLNGHLATITSAEERNFIFNNLGNVATDKSDLLSNGASRCAIRGLAIGATLTLISVNPVAQSINWVKSETSTYENWQRDSSRVQREPSGGDNTEPYLQINTNGDPNTVNNIDGWNDYNGDLKFKTPNPTVSDYQTAGYLVEFE